MTGPSLDLDALREKADAVLKTGADYEASGFSPEFEPAFSRAAYEYDTATAAPVVLAVLSLVDDLRAEIERLREAVGKYAKHDALCACVYDYHNDCTCGLDALRDALAGSPAENKEPT